MIKCGNYLNQEAIDAAMDASNKSMMAQDRAHGVENPEPLYELGRNVCHECYYGVGVELSPTVQYINMMTGDKMKRVCYAELAQQK